MPYISKEKQQIYTKKAYKKFKEQEGWREKLKINRLKANYKLTIEEFDNILIQQNHNCIICKKPLKETKRCIDHNHKTGKIRGILCVKCNTGLGFFQYFWDNPELLKVVINYLKEG